MIPCILQVQTPKEPSSPSAGAAAGAPAAAASTSIASTVNLALLLTLQQQHASALALLEPLYACLDTSYAGVALRVCCLLLDNYLASQQYSKAAQVICYLEATAAAIAAAASSSCSTELQVLLLQDQQQQQGQKDEQSSGTTANAKQDGFTEPASSGKEGNGNATKQLHGVDAKAGSGSSSSVSCDALAVPQLSHYLGPYMEQVRIVAAHSSRL